MCDLTWSAKWADWEKLFSHILHLKGFSPVCVLMCTFKVPFVMKFLPQYSHLNSFSETFFGSVVFFFTFGLYFVTFDPVDELFLFSTLSLIIYEFSIMLYWLKLFEYTNFSDLQTFNYFL